MIFGSACFWPSAISVRPLRAELQRGCQGVQLLCAERVRSAHLPPRRNLRRVELEAEWYGGCCTLVIGGHVSLRARVRPNAGTYFHSRLKDG